MKNMFKYIFTYNKKILKVYIYKFIIGILPDDIHFDLI